MTTGNYLDLEIMTSRMKPFTPFLPTLLPVFAILLAACSGSSGTAGRGLYDGSWVPDPRPAEFDLIHLRLDVSIDPDRELVEGSVEHRLRVSDPTVDSLTFDAGPAITIDSIRSAGRMLGYSHHDRLLHVERPAEGGEVPVRIFFHTTSPGRGIFFTHAEEGEIDGVDGFWTQGEPTDHHRWFPLADRPSDLATSETIVRTKKDWKVISNGALVGTREVPGTGEREWHYEMKKVHAPYLIVVAGSDYLVTLDSINNLDLEYWTWPAFPDRVETTFRQTGDAIGYFDSLLAEPYPWNIYRQVVVDEFIYGGMESTTSTVLDDNLLVDEGGRVDIDPDGTIAHEIAHQWFGDLVTVRDWKDLWIHESFATYLAARYIGSRFGEDRFELLMGEYAGGAAYSDEEEGNDPIVGGDNRPVNIYGRGAVVLNMLNHIIGDRAFTEGMRTFLDEHAHTVVETSDLIAAFEKASGSDLDWFFDQWVFGEDLPVVEVKKEQRGDSVRYRIAQQPRYGNRPEVFRIPTEIQIYYQVDPEDNKMTMKSEKVDIGEKWITTKWYPHRPTNEFMVLAPNASALVQVDYDAGVEELWDQMHVSLSPVDRREAAARLAVKLIPLMRSADENGIASIATGTSIRFDEEPVAEVREALLLIGGITRSAVAREMIVRGTQDPDAGVRMATLPLYRLFDRTQFRTVYQDLLRDSSGRVAGRALRVFREVGERLTDEEHRRLSTRLGTRQGLAAQWVETVGVEKRGEYVDRVAEYAIGGNGRLRVAALEVLGELGITSDHVRRAVLRGVVAEQEEVVQAAWRTAKSLDDDELDRQISAEIAGLSRDEQKRIEEARKG